jgi:hypothetical protein
MPVSAQGQVSRLRCYTGFMGSSVAMMMNGGEIYYLFLGRQNPSNARCGRSSDLTIINTANFNKDTLERGDGL